MAQVPRSSFIPKQKSNNAPTQVRRKRRFNVFSLISTVFIVSSLLAAGVSYGYKELSLRDLKEKSQSLNDKRASFNEADIVGVREISRRLKAGKYILDQHLSPLKIFEALERETLVPVQLSSFTYVNTLSSSVDLNVTGKTDRLGIVSLQSNEFLGNILFEAQQIDSVAATVAQTELGSEKTVTFSISSEIQESSILYELSKDTQTSRNGTLLQSNTVDVESDVAKSNEQEVDSDSQNEVPQDVTASSEEELDTEESQN